MTYLPSKPSPVMPVATTLSDADLIGVIQAGVTKNAMLITLRTFVQAGSSGSTGATSGTGSTSAPAPAPTGSTGTTGTTTGGSTGSTSPTGSTSGTTGATGGGTTVNPTTTNSSPVIRNPATMPAPVSRMAVLTQAQPAFSGTTGSGESANGSEIAGTSGSLTANNGDVFTLRDGGNEIDNKGNEIPNTPRGLCLMVNGNDVRLKEGNSSHGLRYTEKLRWRTAQATGGPGGRATGPQLAIYSEGDWFIAYGPPWSACYLLGEDPNVQDGLVIPNSPPTGIQPFPLGARVGNPDGSTYSDWSSQVAAFLGPVQYINVFNVFGQGWNAWVDAAGYIASNAKNSPIAGSMIPVVGVKLSDGKFYGDNYLGDPTGHDCNKEYRDIINGVHDTVITDTANNWFSQYNLLYLRIAYEFNGEFMPDYFGKYQNGAPDTTTLKLWIAAYKKMADLWRAAATAAGKTVKIVWNPNANQYADNGVKNAWPGDGYVDVIGIDMYAPCYEDANASAKPGDPSLYNGDGTYTNGNYNNDGTFSNSIKDWLTIDRNRVRWWDQGTGDVYYRDKLENQFGFQTALDFIKLKNKPMMMCESGSGNREQWRNTGPCDDPLFPVYLRSRLDQAVNMGIPVVAVMLWMGNESDGGWGCINGERRRQAQAWSAAFGGTQAAALITASGNSTGSTTGSTTGSGSTSGSTGGTSSSSSSTPSASGSTINSASGELIDGAGQHWTLTAISGGYQSLVNGNINADVSGNPIKLLLYYNTVIYAQAADGTWFGWSGSAYINNNGDPRGSSTGTATGIASAKVTDTNGNTATFTLNGYDNFYSTGLACNIYYYADPNGNPTLSSSAPGVVAAVVITENGNNVRVSDDLAGVTSYV